MRTSDGAIANAREASHDDFRHELDIGRYHRGDACIYVYGPTRQYETEAKRARTGSRFQKQAFLDLPRPSRDREEGLEG